MIQSELRGRALDALISERRGYSDRIPGVYGGADIPRYQQDATTALDLMATPEFPALWLLGSYVAEDGSIMWEVEDSATGEQVAYADTPALTITLAYEIATRPG
jgi:hypothetical protein